MNKPFFSKNQIESQKGFTLVELLVSLMLFTVVVLASMGSVLVINNAAHQVDAMRTVLDNLNFAVDSITRTIHTADAVSCETESFDSPQNCKFGTTAGSQTLYVASTIGLSSDDIENGQTQDIKYTVGKDIATNNYQIEKSVNAGTPIALTDPHINIQTLKFYVDGATDSQHGSSDDHTQPQVTVVVQGVAKVGKDSAPFTIQTLVAVRKIEQ